jgi:heterotetrameric sarcosine oxidase gamma subunit
VKESVSVHNETFNVSAPPAPAAVRDKRMAGFGAYPAHQATLCVVKGRDLLQFGGWAANWEEGVGALASVTGCPVPLRVNEGAVIDGLRVMHVAPRRVRLCAPFGDPRLDALRRSIDPELGVVTELGHSRELLRLKGEGVRHLMSLLMPIDFASSSFPLHAIAQSHVHHVPLLAMAVRDEDGEAFDLHVPRTFGQSIADWIVAHGAVMALG